MNSEEVEMKLVRYSPWSVLDEIHDEMNNLFESRLGAERSDDTRVATSQWAPAVDIKEEDDKYVLRADIPGVSPEDIEVSMDKGVLSIKGERKEESEENKEDFHRIERRYGSFYRRFSLPDTADATAVSAEGKNGVLEIVIPKKEQEQPRRIEVKRRRRVAL